MDIWELDHKEGQAMKNWCFWTVVLGKTLESPLDCKEIKLVNPKGNQPWIFTESTDAEPKALIIWPSAMKSQHIGKDTDTRKDWGQEEKGVTEAEMVEWHHRLNGHEFVKLWLQGSLECFRPWCGRVEHHWVTKWGQQPHLATVIMPPVRWICLKFIQCKFW